jgi:hypothetical protein
MIIVKMADIKHAGIDKLIIMKRMIIGGINISFLLLHVLSVSLSLLLLC